MGMSVSRKALMTPEQLRRLPEDEQIIFIKNLSPARTLKIGYQEVSPWREQVDGNPLHAGQRFLGKVKMLVWGGYARASGLGRKATVERKPLIWPVAVSLKPFLPDRSAVLPAALVGIVLTFGWPQLRMEYAGNMSWCRYQGLPVVSQPVVLSGENCPLLIWRK
jgi:type IV secretion system protein VirD4